MGTKVVTIDELGLSTRASNALHRAGIHTLDDLLRQNDEELIQVRNLGAKTLEEIIQKKNECNNPGYIEELTDSKKKIDIPQEASEDLGRWLKEADGMAYVRQWMDKNAITIKALDVLSPKAYNLLMLNGYSLLSQVIYMSSEELLVISRMDEATADEITKSCRLFLREDEEEILIALQHEREAALKDNEESEPTIQELLQNDELREDIYQFVLANDISVDALPISVRAKNVLNRAGKKHLSDFIFDTASEFGRSRNAGAKTIEDILDFVDKYLQKNEARIRAVCSGDTEALWSDEAIQEMILRAYSNVGFRGFSVQELREQADIPERVDDSRIKKNLGHMVANGVLEYVDYRCYRTLPGFMEYVTNCEEIAERDRDAISRKLDGETLESIATDYGVTRERIRQILQRVVKNTRNTFRSETGMECFDEDYYRYFYETYAIEKKDAEQWLGITSQIINYLELCGVKAGKKELQEAVDDYHNLDYGFRLKIKNYLNRNKLFLDGQWVEKRRADLEEYVCRKYCLETVSFDDYTRIYNEFLREEGVEFSEDLYFTDAVIRTRKNRFADARFLLWKQNEKMRYYDIDSRDYTELLDILNLDAYENIAYSTLKFTRDYPEIMDKYDIQDHYELHNLLRKIVKSGSYHEFHCGKMPMIEFGKFDRDGAFLSMLIDNAPISQADFANLISREYGFDPGTVIGSYLTPFKAYYHNGVYSIDQKVMPYKNREQLEEELVGDFYYIDEIRQKYILMFPDADPEEINPYNLKEMGFHVFSGYVLQHYDSLEEYFKTILTREDITDITSYRRKFAYIQAFSYNFNALKKELEILEFEPNQIIHIRKLNAADVSKDDLRAFCDEVYDYVEDEVYFSVKSIRGAGFESSLFELGFSDWFYSSLLSADERFSFSSMFGNIILFKGNQRITIQSFEKALIKEHESIDTYDLVTELEATYGCRVPDRLDVVYKVKGTEIYYDSFLDRLYANIGVFNRELDATEGM